MDNNSSLKSKLKAHKELCDKATEGPWNWRQHDIIAASRTLLPKYIEALELALDALVNCRQDLEHSIHSGDASIGYCIKCEAKKRIDVPLEQIEQIFSDGE